MFVCAWCEQPRGIRFCLSPLGRVFRGSMSGSGGNGRYAFSLAGPALVRLAIWHFHTAFVLLLAEAPGIAWRE